MLNKVILMGRLTRDPELRYTAADIPVVTFTLAVDRGTNKEGVQTADFVPIVTWRSTAEFVSKWFTKGQLVAVSGRLQVRNYKDRDGNKRTATEVVADEVFFAEKKREAGEIDFGETEAVGLPPAASEDFKELYGEDGELPF